jgi:hypothetical protein
MDQFVPVKGLVGRWAKRPPSPPPPAAWRLIFRSLLVALCDAGRFDEAAPMLNRLACLAVNLEPREGFSEWPTVHQRPTGARRQSRVE